MEISKIEAQKEVLDAYLKVIAYANAEQQREVTFYARVNYENKNKADIERAQIRAAAYCDIMSILERAVLK